MRSGPLKRTGVLPKGRKPLTRDCSAEKRTATRKRQQKRAREMRDRDFGPHADYVRSFPCAACGTTAVERVSHHELPRSHKGGVPVVERQIPMCPDCHTDGSQARHKIGRPAFEALHGIDLRAIAADLWRTSPFNPANLA
jgi:hypothetical protein